MNAETSVLEALAARVRDHQGGKEGLANAYMDAEQLAAALGMSTTEVRQVAHALIRRGLVKNHADQSFQLGLTEAGLKQMSR